MGSYGQSIFLSTGLGGGFKLYRFWGIHTLWMAPKITALKSWYIPKLICILKRTAKRYIFHNFETKNTNFSTFFHLTAASNFLYYANNFVWLLRHIRIENHLFNLQL